MGRARKFNQRKRNAQSRKRNSFVVIGCEGNNKTEKIYFKNFNNRNCIIKFSSGNSTDPKGIVQDLVNYINNEIDVDKNDKFYAIFDTDVNQNKELQIELAKKLAKENNIEVITSTPSFEIWFLLHFVYTTKYFSSNEKLQNELKKYILNYTKNSNIYDQISNFTPMAIVNAKKLENYQLKKHSNLDSQDCNPYTAVYKVIMELIKRNLNE